MELTTRLLRWGAARPHLLVAEAPGGAGVRLAVERHVRARGWPVAVGPADADVLVVCGGPDASLQQAVETTWRSMPGPRVRCHLEDVEDVAHRLGQAVAGLADPVAQRADAAARPVRSDDENTPEAEAEQDRPDHSGMDHGDMQMDMDKSLPGGLVMADRAPDRDGLKLDVLHLRLGPVLACWPAGLALDVVLQGDVVQEATVHTYASTGAGSVWTATPLLDPGACAVLTAAAHLDSAGRLLQLAGWGAAAEQAAGIRDDALTGTAAPELRGAVHRLRLRASRSWSLRWGLRGLGVLRTTDAERVGVTGPALRADGDALDRLLQWLFEAEQALDGAVGAGPRARGPAGRAGVGVGDHSEGPRGRTDSGHAPSAALLDALPALVTGLDLAGARLVVASLDPDVAELAAVPTGSAGDG